MAKSKQTLFEQYISNKLVPEPAWYRAVSVRWSVIATSVVICALCMPSVARFIVGVQLPGVPSIGFRWNGKPIVADRTFSIVKPAREYRAECDSARSHAPPVYLMLRTHQQHSQQWAQLSRTIRSTVGTSSQQGLHLIRWLDSVCASKIVVDTVVSTRSPYALLWDGSSAYQRVAVSQLLEIDRVEEALTAFLTQHNVPDSTSAAVVAHVRARLVAARFSLERSQLEQDLAAASVPRTYGIVRRGETIVATGELITPIVAAKLASYRDISSIETSIPDLPRAIGTDLARAALLCGIVWLYLMFVRTDRFDDNRVVVTIASALSLSAVQSLLSTLLSSDFAPEFLVLLPALAMVVTILYDTRLAFVFSTSAVLLHITIRSGDLSSGIALLVASIAGSLSVQVLRNRYQLVRSIFFVALGFVLSLVIAVLENELQFSKIATPVLVASVNAIISPMIVFAVLVLIDRVFGVPTDLRLLELDTVSHPLLVKLRQVAPGTYQHTLVVANLAEHAALAIGANPLLARVGAYFHDIGKIRKPEYFAENQIELHNKHRELSPKQSAAIIRSHVEEGVELALEYRLPPKVIEFIPAHHGTSLIRHFYVVALEEAKATGTEVNEDDFRYQGPKPRTKETGIVMLADVAEAVSRSAESRSDIESRLNDSFREKIADGQLDECPLSLREIATIRRLFTDMLVGMLHQRPEYRSLDAAASSTVSS